MKTTKEKNMFTNINWKKKIKFIVLFAMVSSYVIYVMSIKKDTYTSNVVFSISDEKTQSTNPEMLMMLSGTASNSKQDAMTFKSYIFSTPTIMKVDKKFHLKEYYQSDKVNIDCRLAKDATREEFISLIQKKLKYNFSDESGLSDLKFSFYDKKISKEVIDFLVADGVRFINVLNKKEANKELVFANKEVKKQKKILDQLLAHLKSYEQKNNLVNSQSFIEGKQSLLASLKIKLIEKQSELKNLKFYMKDSSDKVRTLKHTISGLTSEINKLQNELYEKGTGKVFEIENKLEQVKFQKELYIEALKQKSVIELETLKDSKKMIIIAPAIEADGPDQNNKLKTAAIGSLIVIFFWWVGLVIIIIIKEHTD